MVGHGSDGLSNQVLHFGATLRETRKILAQAKNLTYSNGRNSRTIPTHCIKSNVLTIPFVVFSANYSVWNE